MLMLLLMYDTWPGKLPGGVSLRSFRMSACVTCFILPLANRNLIWLHCIKCLPNWHNRMSTVKHHDVQQQCLSGIGFTFMLAVQKGLQNSSWIVTVTVFMMKYKYSWIFLKQCPHNNLPLHWPSVFWVHCKHTDVIALFYSSSSLLN